MIALMVAGTASGAGTTTVALVLMAAMRERCYRVQPFKCGPDFLDAGHHSAISGRVSRNLDPWVHNDPAVRAIFATTIRDVDAAIVEGVMGLYNGVAGGGEDGSAAQIAKVFERFDLEVQFAGIVRNRVGGDRHYSLLETSIRSVTTTPLLGRLPIDPALTIPERHPGLNTTEEATSTEIRLHEFAQAGRQFLDLTRDLTPLISLSWQNAVAESKVGSFMFREETLVRIAVARDKAFSFYYEDNFDLLQESGAEIVSFSPLADAELPPNLEGLYLGGGYPELHADALSRNGSMRSGISAFAETGKPVYAECGGMIYLGKSLTTLDGHSDPMTGLLPMEFEMTPRPVQFGYVVEEFIEDCPLGGKGTQARGHSYLCLRPRADSAMPTAYRLKYSQSGREELEGYQCGNVLASNLHLHCRARPTLARSLVMAARRAQGVEVRV